MIDRRNSFWKAGYFGVVLVACSPLLANAQQHDVKKSEFFESRIRPVLIQHCYECHSTKAAKIKGRLLLDSRDGVLKGPTPQAPWPRARRTLGHRQPSVGALHGPRHHRSAG